MEKAVNILVDSVYSKSQDFYTRLEKTAKGREILKRLMEERIKKARKAER